MKLHGREKSNAVSAVKKKKGAVRVYESKENRGNFCGCETYTSEDIFEVFFCIWCGSLVGYKLERMLREFYPWFSLQGERIST